MGTSFREPCLIIDSNRWAEAWPGWGIVWGEAQGELWGPGWGWGGAVLWLQLQVWRTFGSLHGWDVSLGLGMWGTWLGWGSGWLLQPSCALPQYHPGGARLPGKR